MDSKNPTMYEYAQSQFADGAFIYPKSKMLSITEHISFITVKHATRQTRE